MPLTMLAGMVSTALFVCSTLPMLRKAMRTRDLRSYSLGNILLANGGTACISCHNVSQVGVMGGGRTDIDLGALLPKRATLRGTVLRARPIDEKIAVTQRFAREVLPWYAAGAIRPVIDSRYPLDAIADAHRHMESNANVGKILIDVGD